MVFRVSPSDPRPIYIQIMDEVRRALVVGALTSNDPLPSARQLAVGLRVNPNTVSQAYRELRVRPRTAGGNVLSGSLWFDVSSGHLASTRM